MGEPFLFTDDTGHFKGSGGRVAVEYSGTSGGRWPLQTSLLLPTPLRGERVTQSGGVGGGGREQGNGKRYAMLECYFYFKSHHV